MGFALIISELKVMNLFVCIKIERKDNRNKKLIVKKAMKGRKMNKIIDFKQEGLIGVYVFMEGLNFPIIVGTYSDREENWISYLANNIKGGYFDTEDVCRWCKNHQIQYRIIYPIKKTNVIVNPYKYYKYLQLKHKLQNS